jgi:hypothetical protein
MDSQHAPVSPNYTPYFKMAVEDAYIRAVCSQTELMAFIQKGRGPAGTIQTAVMEFYEDFARLVGLTSKLNSVENTINDDPTRYQTARTDAEDWIQPYIVKDIQTFHDRIYRGLAVFREYQALLAKAGIVACP